MQGPMSMLNKLEAVSSIYKEVSMETKTETIYASNKAYK